MSTPEAMGASAQGSPDRAKAEPTPRASPVLDWLLVRDELLRARANANRLPAEQREYLRRAKLAFELGELALAPGNAVRSGSAAPLAANLFRQSVYWALLAQSLESGRPNPTALWAAADTSAFGSVATAQISAAMGSTFVELAEGSPDEQRATADQLRRAAARLIKGVERPLWQLEWSMLKRLARVLAVLTICLVPLIWGAAVLLKKPDLAIGKHWRTSSIGLVCHPEKSECGGATTEIFFHTALEQDPWFEYDFGLPLAFSALTIVNRSDFGPERAVPLVVEVSNDDKNFQEIARRLESFGTWKPSFPTQHARYLRLRVDRESMLHLEAVKVHP